MNTSDLLSTSKTIAIVGLSDKPERPSYQVAEYLFRHGYAIIPVNPMIDEVFDIKAYHSISDIPLTVQIDIVDIFRKSEDVLPIVNEVIETGRKPAIWMQEGVSSNEAKELAESQGMEVVMDMCMMKVHQAFSRPQT